MIVRYLGAIAIACSAAFLACANTNTASANSPTSKSSANKSAIDASDYSQACSKDAECVTIYEGDGCQACRCINAAIQKSDLARYRQDLARFDACHHPEGCGADCDGRIGAPAKCQSGRCVWVSPY